MINKMRRKALATALALTMIVGTVAGNGMVVKAADEDYDEEIIEGENTDSSVDPLAASDVENSFDIDVTADVAANQEKYVYNIKVQYGKMKFNYSTGSQWDPATHSYGTATGTGWDSNDNVAKNNDIIIMNNSNMPVKVQLSYTSTSGTINSYDMSTNAACGVFSLNKDDFDYTENGSDASKSIKMNGTNSGHAKIASTNKTMTILLDTDASNVFADSKYTNTIGRLNTPGDYNKTVWFGLSGIPDTSFTGSVGKINVVINRADTTDYTVKHKGDS